MDDNKVPTTLPHLHERMVRNLLEILADDCKFSTPAHLPLTLQNGENGPHVNSRGDSAVAHGSLMTIMRETLLADVTEAGEEDEDDVGAV